MTENPFRIIECNPEFEKSIKSLPSHIKKEISKVKKILQQDPFFVAKPLKFPLEGKWVVRIGNNRYRMICRIEFNTRKIFLYYVRLRSSAYNIDDN